MIKECGMDVLTFRLHIELRDFNIYRTKKKNVEEEINDHTKCVREKKKKKVRCARQREKKLHTKRDASQTYNSFMYRISFIFYLFFFYNVDYLNFIIILS